MQAAGVLWPGLQVYKTIKERKALHVRDRVRHRSTGHRSLSSKKQNIGEPVEVARWKRRGTCTKKAKASQVKP